MPRRPRPLPPEFAWPRRSRSREATVVDQPGRTARRPTSGRRSTESAACRRDHASARPAGRRLTLLATGAAFSHVTAAARCTPCLCRHARARERSCTSASPSAHALRRAGSRRPSGRSASRRIVDSRHGVCRHHSRRARSATSRRSSRSPQLVAVGDRLVLRRGARQPHARLTRGAVADYPGTARDALGCVARSSLSTTASESPKESELRVVLHRGRASRPARQRVSVFDDRRTIRRARRPRRIAHLKIAIEYEGDHHRDQVPVARRSRSPAPARSPRVDLPERHTGRPDGSSSLPR